MAAPTKLGKLRALFASSGPRSINAFVIPSADAHQSEYVSARDERRAFISDFTGSAGTAVVTATEACLWTDGRYYLQASQQLSDEWTLMKAGRRDTPSIEAWLTEHLDSGDAVGIDPFLMSVNGARAMESALAAKGIELQPVANLVDVVWDDQPAPPSSPVVVHDVKFAGKAFTDKLHDVREAMGTKGASALVVSALDEIAWLFNIRGSDIQFNPVSIAYAVVTATDAVLFIDKEKLSDAVSAHFGDAVAVRPYDSVIDYLHGLAGDDAGARKIWLDPATCNFALAQAVPKAQRLEATGPVPLMKSLKNKSEIDGMRDAHVRDAAALVSFFSWLETSLRDRAGGVGADSGDGAGAAAGAGGGAPPLTEYSVSEKLASLRAAQPNFVSLSFATIAGSGPNGAVIHYKPEADTAAEVTDDRLFLCDSGGQYVDGTTDVTRTVHFGTPTPYEKFCYTKVLQGHIAVATAVFPAGTSGNALDPLARLPLWKAGLEYRHGTGHGVGAFLNVHEGPQGMSFRPRAYTGGLQAGMTMTDEPGYYETGKFGIRIESVLVVREADTPHKFDDMQFLEFENITFAPIQTKLIDLELLTPEELAWVNAYNATCREKVSPLLSGPALEYLLRETEPIAKA